MSTSISSRRAFLGNLAVLTAGMTISSQASALLPRNKETSPLELLWKEFCTVQQAENYRGALPQQKEITPCKGHQHRKGQSVYFPKEKLIAQPVWIYWASEAGRASDLVVQFYPESKVPVTLNRYELRQLCNISRTTNAGSLTRLLKPDSKNGRRWMAVTKIGSGQNMVA